jgi:cell division protein FtsN
MRKIFIAIAASLLVAVGSAVSLQQVHSKFLQTAQAQQAHDEIRDHPAPEHEEEHEAHGEEEENGEWPEDGEEEGEWDESEEPEEEEPEEDEEDEEEPAEDGEEEPLELA